ncbi:MAG TPA: thioredoxin, partial [Candidatus Omnitrophota bacterium]|nr:thioredoxin [Candidatus Omnitrophota bacterium]
MVEVPELTDGEFCEFIKKGNVLVDFFAEWCMPCLMMTPVIDELSEKFNGKIRFGKVNVDDNSKIAQKFHVTSIPTFILFKDGNPVEHITGSMPNEEFGDKLSQF